MVARTVVLFLVAVVAELTGTYAVWRWLRAGSTAILGAVGVLALFTYAAVQALQPEGRYGRLYAAYAGVFLVGAMLWGWAADKRAPDRFDLAGAVLVLLGAATILWGRRLGAG